MIGKVLSDRYKLLQLLSEGGTSDVFLAQDNSTGQNVVIKLIKEHLLHGAAGDKFKMIERLQREVKMSEQINNPDIIIAKSVDEHKGRYYIVLDYVDGISLDVLMEREFFGLGFILRLITEISRLLECAHSKGVIHRDLKPSNIMITEEGRVKILDFGYALNLMDLTKLTYEGSILGTASYIAPEQAMDSTVDGRADLYSIGVMFYELLTGRKPFSGTSQIKVIMHQVSDPPKSPSIYNPDIPLPIEQIVMKLLEKKPEKRFSSAGELIDALQKVMGEEELPEDLTCRNISFLNPRASFIGREKEFKELYTEVDALKDAEEVKVLMITGSEGTGKTRFIEELETYTKIRNFLFLKGSCFSDKKYVPFNPLVQGIYTLMEQEGSNLWKQLLQNKYSHIKECVDNLFPAIFSLLDFYIRKEDESSDNAAKTLLEFLGELTNIKPVVIVIDDFHWTDISTFNFILNLKKNKENMPLLVVCTLDEDKMLEGFEIVPYLGLWKTEFTPKIIELKNFNPGETGEIVKSILMTEYLDIRLIEKIFVSSRGNPLFIKELINLLVENKYLVWKDKKWNLDNKNFAFPENIEELFSRKIEALNPSIKDLLVKLSVLGNSFPYEYLNLTLEDDDDDENDDNKEMNEFLLEHVIKNKILNKNKINNDEIYSFSNRIIKHLIYKNIYREDRRELHLKIAQKLELTFEEWEIPELIELFNHFSEGRDYSLANFYLTQAADKAKSIGLYDAARVIYSKALEVSERYTKEDVESLKKKLKEVSPEE